MSSLARPFLVNCMRPEKKIDIAEEENFKSEVGAINPNIGIATLLSNTHNSMVQTKFGSSPVGSTNSYQLPYTESKFLVYVNIRAVPRCPDPNFDINSYPQFPLKDTTARVYPDTLFRDERTFLSSLEVEIAITSEPTVSEDVPGSRFISCHVSEEGSGTAPKSSKAKAFFSPVG